MEAGVNKWHNKAKDFHTEDRTPVDSDSSIWTTLDFSNLTMLI